MLFASTTRRHLGRFLLLLPMLAVVVGCQSMASKTQSPEEYLSVRAAQRWQHLINREWDAAYAMLSPGVRSAATANDYARAMSVPRNVLWEDAHTASVECPEAERCLVKVTVRYRLVGVSQSLNNVKSSHLITETWLRIGGDWYFVPAKGVG